MGRNLKALYFRSVHGLGHTEGFDELRMDYNSIALTS
jgi:hypothetical protein